MIKHQRRVRLFLLGYFNIELPQQTNFWILSLLRLLYILHPTWVTGDLKSLETFIDNIIFLSIYQKKLSVEV